MKSRTSKQQFERLGVRLSQPGAWAFIWACGFGAALIGSLFAAELRSLDTYTNSASAGWAVAYVEGVVFLIVAVAAQRSHQMKSEREVAESLNGSIGKVQELVRTLPPDTFGEGLVRLFPRTYAVAQAASISQGNDRLAALRDAIQDVLRDIQALATVFEADENAHLCANLMVFVPRERWDADAERSLKNILRFWCGASLDGLSGALALDPKFLISADDSSSTLDWMALPVADCDVLNPKRVLPGAPKSFLLKEHFIYPDVEHLLRECRDGTVDVLRETTDAIERHFKEASIASFLSTAVRQPDTDQCVGVLNLHSNRLGLLRSSITPDPKPALRFLQCIAPHVTLLGYLVGQLVDHGTKALLPVEAGGDLK